MARHVSLEATATATPANNFPFRVAEKIIFISNDSSSVDMKINFDKSIDETGAFTLKAGEAVSDILTSCNTISFAAVGAGNTAAFRILGV